MNIFGEKKRKKKALTRAHFGRKTARMTDRQTTNDRGVTIKRVMGVGFGQGTHGALSRSTLLRFALTCLFASNSLAKALTGALSRSKLLRFALQ